MSEKFLIDALAGGAGALAYKEYEKRRERDGLPPAHHQGAKEVLAGIVSFEVAKHLQEYEAKHGKQQVEHIEKLKEQVMARIHGMSQGN
ncbi:hypothetical protein M427DRAFT_52601 [Gonapodya prolifera JEL478]|uniref:Uncharacterized protein n=1 Tax=Gonapodya prolifera (strain JEL478) TaxID=1344416 RepID=A0A139AT85_GONPJ|nr:hypothetical protein M427DRAFT_52601 [Gonapodya prolifera JEL478]|eukprot:KXS19715.1 hypothetical protein M427DRAFT_52601 [Gonapodya prolifera JEL478]